LQPLEVILFSRKVISTLTIHIILISDSSLILKDILQNKEYVVNHFSLERNDDGTAVIKLTSHNPRSLQLIATSLSEDNRVKSIQFQ